MLWSGQALLFQNHFIKVDVLHLLHRPKTAIGLSDASCSETIRTFRLECVSSPCKSVPAAHCGRLLPGTEGSCAAKCTVLISSRAGISGTFQSRARSKALTLVGCTVSASAHTGPTTTVVRTWAILGEKRLKQENKRERYCVPRLCERPA